MKSTEVYREAKTVLAPWCKANQFKRTQGGMLGWQQQLGEKFLTFWLQCSRDGWDPCAGSKLAVEFQFCAKLCLGDFGPDCFRKRFPYFLRDEQLEEVRQIQNDVIASLSQPPANYYLNMEEDVATWYRAKFAPVNRPYIQTDDIWLRYHKPEHVRRWAAFLLQALPRIVTELTPKAT